MAQGKENLAALQPGDRQEGMQTSGQDLAPLYLTAAKKRHWLRTMRC